MDRLERFYKIDRLLKERKVEVLAPPALRRRVAQSLAEAARRYR